MGIHTSESAITHHAKRKGLRASRKFTVVGAAIAVLGSTGAAWAFISLSGTGAVTAEAGTVQDLVISQESLSKKLVPGTVADLRFRVANRNDFPVKVTQVALAGTPSDVVPAGCISKISSPLVTTGTAFDIPAGDQVAVPAGDSKVVTLTGVVKLDESATAGCGFKVAIRVTAVQTAGN